MSWDDIKVAKPKVDALEAAAKAAQRVSKKKAPKAKAAKTFRISIEFSDADHKKIMKKLDGRPANSHLSKIILESMFGDKK